MGNVAKLVAEAAGSADGLVDVAVGVAVDPVVDSAASDVVGLLDGECAVDTAALEFWGNQLIRRDVVGDDDFVLGVAGTDRLLDEVEAALVFAVEIGTSQQILAIQNTMKVGNSTLVEIGICWVNMSPKG